MIFEIVGGQTRARPNFREPQLRKASERVSIHRSKIESGEREAKERNFE